jgi:ectoine hydroxylase-related dioxygenase (phytanoyl-CoA dioxygenase family)
MIAEAPTDELTAVTEIRERGYTVLEGVFSDDEIASLRAPIERRYEALGRPPTFARPPLEPAPDVEISVVGLVFHKLGAHFPELAAHVFRPPIVQVARGVLGDDMHLEYTSAVVNMGDRPFFPWHMHVGGVDNVVYRKGKLFPDFERSERVTMLLYLHDLTPEAGTLLAYPRRVRDSTLPPHDPTLEHWDGEVELACRQGTVVLMEQCTWHAAKPKRSRGLRAFVAAYFTSSAAKKTSWVDDSLRPFAAEGSLLASMLPSA